MDLGRLRRIIESYDPLARLEEAWTPPASWYVDPDVFVLERRSVFGASWQFAGRADMVRGPGSYVAGRAGGEPFVIVRDKAGTLRAFYNVCRHHAAIVAQGAGTAEVLTCPYHGWSYHLNGQLCKAPRLGAIAGFERERFGLLPMHLAEWQGFLLVHVGEPERSPDEELAELGTRLAAMDTGKLHFVATRSYDIECNWKVFVDNYLDGGYHVPHAHPELASQIDMSRYRTEVFGRYSIQSCPGKGDAASREIGGATLQGRIGGQALYAWIYPNFMINRYGPAMDTNLVVPLGPGRTRVVFDFYFEEPEGAAMEAFVARSLESADQTQREDTGICESVQEGLGSRAYDRGRLAPAWEMGEKHFHGLLAHDLRRGLAAMGGVGSSERP